MSLTLLLDIYLIWSPQALNVNNLITRLDLIFDLLIRYIYFLLRSQFLGSFLPFKLNRIKFNVKKIILGDEILKFV